MPVIAAVAFIPSASLSMATPASIPAGRSVRETADATLPPVSIMATWIESSLQGPTDTTSTLQLYLSSHINSLCQFYFCFSMTFLVLHNSVHSLLSLALLPSAISTLFCSLPFYHASQLSPSLSPACQEAYIKLLEQEACSTGCASQPSEPEIKRRKLKAMTLRPKPPSVMEAVSSWCNDIVSSAQSFISSTWTFYLQADDGKVVVFQSQPELEYSLPELQASRSNVVDKPWPQVHSHTQRPHGVRGHGEKGVPKAGGKGKHPVQHTDDPTAEHDFLGCMSRRSGLPRWILAACLFLSIMVMLWLSCASLVTAPEQHVKTQLSINGDKDFLDNAHKVNPYHLSPVIAVPVKQSEESQEAGPLPVKLDLNKTCI
uniref:transmembrane protein 59-like isoform X1 n=1 Tax=Monopterus albus TaxID=43700 RepID=UPI0009B3040D|nr:transmembrane protein 59-like isoform X1 [Monopterus albus]